MILIHLFDVFLLIFFLLDFLLFVLGLLFCLIIRFFRVPILLF